MDLNADLGESLGRWTLGDDAALVRQLSSANLACGFHAGDPRVMEVTVELCRDAGVAVGAQPGYPDLLGFGRRAMAIPPDDAQAALYRAMELAPSDGDLRFKVAADFERRDMIAEAIAIIRPEAYRVPERRDESERERAARLRQEDRYRRAGTVRTESAREMLDRLLRKQQQAQPPAG